MNRPIRRSIVAAGLLLLVGADSAPAPYPLDGAEATGIRRLKAYRMVREGTLAGNIPLPPGALLPSSAIRLRLADVGADYDPGPPVVTDSVLQAGLQRLLRSRSDTYRIALLDITDPSDPRYAEVRGGLGYIPGSVGKLLVLTGLFNELQKLHPTDTRARARILRDTRVVADHFAMPNSHAVPIVADDFSRLTHRAIVLGDEFSLWEWVDHMVSPSSNAAGSVVWKEALLLNEFGSDYPPTPEEAAAFFTNTPKPELTERSIRILEEPLVAAGIDTTGLHLRTFFTRGGQRVVPGRGSHSTPRELVRWLVRLEQGRLVDRWSSLEMKKLMYFTRRRYRYAASPALADAAVFFKSGSLYRCQPEEGYECGQYRGNVENLLHSVAIVETPAVPSADAPQRRYLVSMMSNVLKVNSAAEHAEIASEIDRLIKSTTRP
ncbi:MAG: hypothetical protein OEO23_08980 [Gemmatimonadota bacterium]|nr:hypothetical protein [Gemmatimonadota bacterium]